MLLQVKSPKGVVMTIVLVSIGLLFNGIASILSGITGNPRLYPTTKSSEF